MNINLDDMEAAAGDAAGLLRELANANRLMILCHLSERELSVSALGELVGLTQSALSQHLARMREQGLVQTRREGQTIYYSLSSDDVRRIIATLYELYCAPAGTEAAAEPATEGARR